MLRVEPATARYTVEESESFLRITIPARRTGQWLPWLGVAWVVVFLTMLGKGFAHRAESPDGHVQTGALATALFVVALVCVFAVAPLVWMYCGREEITIAGRMLLRRLRAGPLTAKRAYALGEARRFRISARHAAACSLQLQPLIPLGIGRGTIHFDLGGETRYLGSALDETEAAHVLARIVAHLSARADASAGPGPLVAGVAPGGGSKRELHLTLRPWRKAALVILASCGVAALVFSISSGGVDSEGLWACSAYGLIALAWLGFVREEITVREGLLVRRIGAGFLRRTQVYALENSHNLRLALLPPNLPRRFRDFVLGGSVWFDNGERLAKLGAGLGEVEAAQLVSRLSAVIGRA